MSSDADRPPVAALEALANFATATVHEAMGGTGALAPAVKPLYPGMRLCGPALPVDCPAGDNLMLHAAIAEAAPGEVLVVDFKGCVEAGPFGDVLAHACRLRGILGLVIDGTVRDGAALRAMGFPVFARGLCMAGTSKRGPGSVGLPVVCAGVRVARGDLVLGDDDGVVVVPRDGLQATIEAAERREAKEAELRAALETGRTTVELLGLEAALAARR